MYDDRPDEAGDRIELYWDGLSNSPCPAATRLMKERSTGYELRAFGA